MNYYDEIKRELINNELTKKIKDYGKNKSDLNTYYNVGKILNKADKRYGKGVIKDYSKRLSLDLNARYEASSLNKMKKFYLLIEKMATVSPKLSYSHYVELLPYEDIDKVKYYIKMVENQNLSVRELRYKIKSKEYERLDEETNEKLIETEEMNATDFVKNPIYVKNNINYEHVSEKILQKLILEDITSFLDELGSGFAFVGNEYKIKIGCRYNYIDFLLFNIEYNCYVVVELKITELKKEHIGQIQVYMNYIDSNLKKINMNKTIGLIICKRNNKYVIEYSSDKRIIAKEYELV